MSNKGQRTQGGLNTQDNRGHSWENSCKLIKTTRDNEIHTLNTQGQRRQEKTMTLPPLKGVPRGTP